jgi:bifunctional non-homologous end joining protein LigD
VSPERVETEVDGRRLSISNLDKVLYPQTGFTKGAMIDYYLRIAPAILPHVIDRPLTVRRFPNGVDEKSFFEKHAPSHTPDWVRTTFVPTAGGGRRRTKGDAADGRAIEGRATEGRGAKSGGVKARAADDIEYAVISDRAGLAWAANLAAIEMHVPLWHIGDGTVVPAPPDHLVFDLDPGPDTSIVECCRVAQWIEGRLSDEGIGPVLAKTSGSKGLQLYVRLATGTGWEEARHQALEVAQAIESDHPELVVTKMGKDLRRRRVLIDWSQNHPVKTTVAAYSMRARPEPTVSTPVTWDEVVACEKSGEPADLRFLAPDVLERVERHGDLMASLARD